MSALTVRKLRRMTWVEYYNLLSAEDQLIFGQDVMTIERMPVTLDTPIEKVWRYISHADNSEYVRFVLIAARD